MDYEKSYKEALERAKKLKETCDSTAVIGWCEHIFPELKGNEDRKIRNAIYDALKYLEREHSWDFLGDVDILDAYTWLEKQGEQKSINDLTQQEAMDIADTKFKIGDWIVYNRNDHSRKIMQIYDIRDNRYYFNDNIHFSWSVKECDEKSHLWTIKDAKDGDVLHSPSHHLIWVHKDRGQYYACVNTNYAQHYNFDINGLLGIPKDVFPATKDEQTILFERIKRAGYEWDEDKKELIKL